MTSIATPPINIQTISQTVPRAPSWFGALTMIAHNLPCQGACRSEELVRFARRRFGPFHVIDCVAVLFGYAVGSEWTLEAFHERLSLGPARS